MKTIVCYGDSITWGCLPFASVAAPPIRLAKAQRWAHVMAREIMAREIGQELEIVEDGLSGRTTIFDDPIEGAHKNGSRHLPVCIEANSPLDLLIIMLGGNDFKIHFNATAFTSARGMLTLIHQVKGFYALSDGCPEILIVTPPKISTRAEPAFWGDAWQRCQGHADYLSQVAERTGCHHFDANSVTEPGMDGTHIDARGHEALGKALATQVSQILAL